MFVSFTIIYYNRLMIKKIFFYILILLNQNFVNQYFTANIAKSLLDDKEFAKEFIKKYGNIYDILKNQVQAWMNVMGYGNVTINQLKIIFNNMYIPIEERKQFFIKLENIILKVSETKNKQLLDGESFDKNKKESLDKNKKYLMMEIYKRYKLFYNPSSIFWHLQNWQFVGTLEKKSIYDVNYNLLSEKLSFYLVSRKILDKNQIEFFKTHWDPLLKNHNISWTYIIYGLVLRAPNNKKKLTEILNNYPANQKQKLFIKFLINHNFNCSVHHLLSQYKNAIKYHENSNHEILILLIQYIVINRKNNKVSDKEWLDMFKIILQYYEKVLMDLQGIGISYFFKSMKILLQKQIYKGNVLKNNSGLKKFLTYLNDNQNLIFKWCQEEIYNPYFLYFDQFILDNLEIYLQISKKNYSKKKAYIIEFFSVINIINILYENFNDVLKWSPFIYILAVNCHKYHQEQAVYFIVLSCIQLIASNGDKNNLFLSNETQSHFFNYKNQMDFWIEKIKTGGQISLYGQFISDKFLNGYRRSSYFSLALTNAYKNTYNNTIRKNLPLEEIQHTSKDYGKLVSKYDWIVFLGIYVLYKENIDINITKNIITKNNKQYHEVFNNKYSITKKYIYQWDYILKIMPSKALESLTILSKPLILLSLKKYRYMAMLGETVEKKTGVVNCFSLHPMNDFLQKYNQEKFFNLSLLSGFIRKETMFTLKLDGKNYNFFEPHIGSGLFQINFFNGKKICQELKIPFNEKQLQEDIQFNFLIFIHFLKKLCNWLKNKHVINWIISYNGSQKSLKSWHNLLNLYKIPNYNQDIKELYSPFIINLIGGNITRHYCLNVLSYFNSNSYFADENYINIFLKDTNPWQ